MIIRIGARGSLLSRAQVEELYQECRQHRDVTFETVFVDTTGDLDRKTSLRTLEKTDFFTRELDILLARGKIDAAVHSAKDLPDPLPPGLELIGLTRGVDPRDCIVMRRNESLRPGMRIGTSSERREEAVRALEPGCTFIDLRGTIAERLAYIESGALDGVVVAEAALIRLGLTSLPRLYLDGEPAAGQGRLAVVARQGDEKMKELFSWARAFSI